MRFATLGSALLVGLFSMAASVAQDQQVVPPVCQAVMDLSVGTWVYDGTVGEKAIRGRWVATWGPGKQCLIYRERGVIRSDDAPPLKYSGIGTAYYDSVSKRFVEVMHFSDGNHITNTHPIPAKAEGDLVLVGAQTMVKSDGRKLTGKIQWEFLGRDVVSYSVVGENDALKIEFRRQKPKGDMQAKTESTRAEFNQFGKRLVGRWVGDITLVYDWPGYEKGKGDKLTSYETFKWITDEKAIEWEHFGGNTTGRTTIVWDPASKQIKAFNVQSAGGTWQTVIWRVTDKKWGWKVTAGGLPDGTKMTGAGYWLFSDGRKSLVITGDVKVGGEKVDPVKDVYRRVDH